MKKMMAWAVLALLPLVGCGSDEPEEEMFSARLDGAQVFPTPPSVSLAGEAGFTFDGQSIAFSADLRGLTLARQGNRFLRLRIHSGVRGTNGPPLATTTLLEFEIAATGDRYLWQGQLGAAQLDTTASVQDVVTAMRTGGAYVQVTHWEIGNLGQNAVTAARGQIESGN